MKTLRTFATVLVLGTLMALLVERFSGSPAVATPPDPRLIALLAMTNCPGCPGDINGDNIVNSADLSVLLANFGNVCQPDSDGDGVPNNLDNCPNTPNTNQADIDADGAGDVCDNCPVVPNPGQQDSDNDGIGDVCEGSYCLSGGQCPALPNTIPSCVNNTCQYACNTGYADCNNNIQLDGCEVYLLSDGSNCGACGVVCPPNHVCVNGQCVLQCPLGQTNCGGNCVNLLTDTQNCGGCGVVCSPRPNATTTCTNGVCSFFCNAGFADCNAIAADGCEVNTTNSTSNCGNCGLTCPPRPNAIATCTNGVCSFFCNTGFADCNAIAADGCEVNLLNSVNNCNACGNVCVPTANVATVTCVNGNCKITGCLPNYQDLNGIYADGCEVFNNPN